jgi:hypothetical protein
MSLGACSALLALVHWRHQPPEAKVNAHPVVPSTLLLRLRQLQLDNVVSIEKMGPTRTNYRRIDPTIRRWALYQSRTRCHRLRTRARCHRHSCKARALLHHIGASIETECGLVRRHLRNEAQVHQRARIIQQTGGVDRPVMNQKRHNRK